MVDGERERPPQPQPVQHHRIIGHFTHSPEAEDDGVGRGKLTHCCEVYREPD